MKATPDWDGVRRTVSTALAAALREDGEGSIQVNAARRALELIDNLERLYDTSRDLGDGWVSLDITILGEINDCVAVMQELGPLDLPKPFRR